MPTTSNFGWTTPADTDLVKDGAAAIRTLGNGVDASFIDLKGGTTGQVLSKATNTDLDFTWINPDPLTILDAKGDLITATAADTPARLAVGANGKVLTADSTAATGLAWGDALPAWTTFNPAVKQSVTVTSSNLGTRYIKVGTLVIYQIAVDIGSTGTANNTITIELPFQAASNAQSSGTFILSDNSAAAFNFGWLNISGDVVELSSGLNNAKTSLTSKWGRTGSDWPNQLGNLDYIMGSITYRSST